MLDKTGTVTAGEPVVTDIIPAEDVTENELLSLALSLEAKSEHPLAKAINVYGTEHKIPSVAVDNFKALSGNGLTAAIGNDTLYGGSLKFIGEKLLSVTELNLKRTVFQVRARLHCFCKTTVCSV